MNNELTEQMLSAIPNQQMRQQYADILNGMVNKLVHCNSKTCKGRVIAEIINETAVTTTQVRERLPILDKKGKYGLYSSGLEGSRQRLDGQWGFRCYCGNNSILAEAEQGIITPNTPTKRDIEKIFGRLTEKPAEYAAINGATYVDGFTLEAVN